MAESDPDEEQDTNEIKLAVHNIDSIDGSNATSDKDEKIDNLDSQENIVQMDSQCEVQDSCQQTGLTSKSSIDFRLCLYI